MDEDRIHDIFELIMWIVAGGIVVWLLTGCSVCRKCEYRIAPADSIYIERIDSVFIKDTILKVQMRDSLVYAVADSASHLETDVALSDAWIEEGKLHHRLENKRDLIPINVELPQYISREVKHHFQIVTKKVNELTPTQGFWITLGKIFAILLVVFAIYKFLLRRL